MVSDLYGRIARYYDLLHRDLTDDVDFVLDLARRSRGPILELGCGTGRLLTPLLTAGHDVVGIDHSPSMLELANERLVHSLSTESSHSLLIQADMEALPFVGSCFSLAVLSYNTFMHVPPAAAVATCRAIRRCLRWGGCILFDLPNPMMIEAGANDGALTLERVMKDEPSDDTVVVMASNQIEVTAQAIHVTWIFDRSRGDEGPVHRTVANMPYHYYFPHQIELALAESDLLMEAIYGDYRRTPFTEDSERLLIVGRK